MNESIIAQFLNGTSGMIAVVAAALVAMVKTFSLADGVFQRVRERKVKRLMHALRMLRLHKTVTPASAEESIYREALQQEMFRLTLGVRATKQSREYLSTISDLDITLNRAINIFSLTSLKKDKNGYLRFSYWPLMPLFILGTLFMVTTVPYMLLVLLSVSSVNSVGVLEPLLALLYGMVLGGITGFIARITIKPLFEVRKINLQFAQHPINSLKNSASGQAVCAEYDQESDGQQVARHSPVTLTPPSHPSPDTHPEPR